MLMNLKLKQCLIILSTFIVILWYQKIEDKKYKRHRKTVYDQIKFPLLISSIIGLLLNLPNIFITESCDITVVSPITVLSPVKKTFNTDFDLVKPFTSNFSRKNISDQQIYTDLPDF
jgi:hypothetical protein